MEKRLMLFLVSFFLSAGIAMAQTQVSGTVISSEDNEPIIGASIIMKDGRSDRPQRELHLICTKR